MKEKFAKFIRIITVPPVLVSILIFILAVNRSEIFHGPHEILLSLICLAIVPVLAYPLQPVIPGLRDRGREGQRKLAFILSFAGYTAAMVLGLCFNSSPELKLIFGTYFLSVIILIIFNKFLKLRASGHACSITGPLVFLIYFIGARAILPCIVIFALIIWSSLVLKRHTPKDLTFGAAVSILSFLINYLMITMLYF